MDMHSKRETERTKGQKGQNEREIERENRALHFVHCMTLYAYAEN